MKRNANIAVLLATYNGSKFLSELLESMSAQTCQDFVIFARDDGSSDHTREILKSFSNRLSIYDVSDGIRLGPAKSFMKLLELAGDNYRYFAFADQDDVWKADKLTRALELIGEDRSTPAMYCSRLEYVNENLDLIKLSPKPRTVDFRNALVENIATGCTVVINKEARSLVMSSLPKSYTMHDWWLYVVLSAFGEVIYDSYPSIKYRQHSNNVIGSPAPLIKWARRLRRLWLNEKNIYGIYRQANEFLSCFESRLKNPHLEQLRNLLDGKRGFLPRFRLCVASPFIRQQPLDTLILRLLFILNRY